MADLLIAVEITPEVASKIRFMAQEGIFGIHTGSAELHFKDGNLLTVITKKITHSSLSTRVVDTPEIPPIV